MRHRRLPASRAVAARWMRRQTGARDGDGDFDDGPEADEEAVAKGVLRHGVDVECAEADDGCGRGEGADAKDAEEGEDPDVCYDGEDGCGLGDDSLLVMF